MHCAEDCILPVVERFVSVNGEGPRAGRLAAFIRFAGCNLACSWCDTAWANVGNCEHEDCTTAELVEWVAGSGAQCVTLTGGEPALQPGLPALIGALCASEVWGLQGSRVIELETNGAVDLAQLHQLRCELGCTPGGPQGFGDSQVPSSAQVPGSAQAPSGAGVPGDVPDQPTRIAFTVDCKMPSSGMTQEMLPGNYELLGPGDAVKFVVASREDLECAQRVIEQHSLCSRCEVFFSPVFSCIEPSQIVCFMQEQGLANVRLQLQLHKIIWPGQEKGV